VVVGDRRDTVSAVQRIDGRTFYLYLGFWVDQDFTEKLPLVKVKYLSDAYFKLLEKLPALKNAFALGERVIVVVNGTAIAVQAEGKEPLTDEELNALAEGRPLPKAE
jgi:Ca-activated chloride channel family protein